MERNLLNKIILVCLVLTTFFACSSRKEIVYFQNNAELTTSFENYIPTIQPSDVLAISISASDLRATEVFNQVSVNSGAIASSPFTPTYTVDKNGNIQFPVLGEIHLGGLTKNEAIINLKSKIAVYIKDPGVVLNITNFKITVLGEVKQPGTFPINSERVTILEALGLAGDLTIRGVRNNVMVVRERDGKKETHFVDLTTQESMNSPVYYLAQNDVIYVEPNSAQISAAKFTPNYSLWISVIGVILSVITVIIR